MILSVPIPVKSFSSPIFPMANRLDDKTKEFIRDCYAKGMKPAEVRGLVKERFGLDVSYTGIKYHNPVDVTCRRVYGYNENKRLGAHIKKIGEMADDAKGNVENPKRSYIFSRKDGKATRKRILDYIEAEPGAHYRKILAALDLNNGILYYHLKRLEDEGRITREKDGNKVRYRLAEEK